MLVIDHSITKDTEEVDSHHLRNNANQLTRNCSWNHIAYCDITFLKKLHHVESNRIKCSIFLEAFPKGKGLINVIGLFDKVKQSTH